MYYYFYKIRNNINGKYYYGVHSTNDMNDGYMGSGYNIKKAIKKYGIENFTKIILRYFVDEQEMYDYERLIVNKDLIKDPNCYNICTGGHGGNTKAGYSKEQFEKFCTKLSETKKGKPTWNYKKPGCFSEETLQKIGKASTGRIAWNKGLTKETDKRVAKISALLKGHNTSEETRQNISKANKGKIAWNKDIPWSEEVKEKIRKAKAKQNTSDEQDE